MSPEFTDVVEHRFRTAGAPYVRVENVAGETLARGGAGEEVVVRARKRAHAESADRGKRVLDAIEVEVAQHGDEIFVSQRAFLLERGWSNLFRDRRALIDYDIELPRAASVSVQTASGEVKIANIEGSVEAQSVSGDVAIAGVRGPVRLRSVSGDCVAEGCAGAVDANSVSGDLSFRSCAWSSGRIRTISGEVEAEVRLDGDGPVQVNTLSGDVELITSSPCRVVFDTTSGDLDVSGGVEVERRGRRGSVVQLGEGGAEVHVRTVSGDFELRRGEVNAPEAAPAEAPAAAAVGRDRKAEALAVLRELERGEIDADEAGRRLDAARS